MIAFNDQKSIDLERQVMDSVSPGTNSKITSASGNMDFVRVEEQFKRVNPANRYKEGRKEVDFKKLMQHSMNNDSLALSNGIMRGKFGAQTSPSFMVKNMPRRSKDKTP